MNQSPFLLFAIKYPNWYKDPLKASAKGNYMIRALVGEKNRKTDRDGSKKLDGRLS